VPIPGTTQIAHMLDNSGAAAVRFTPPEIAELNASVSAIKIEGAVSQNRSWRCQAWRRSEELMCEATMAFASLTALCRS